MILKQYKKINSLKKILPVFTLKKNAGLILKHHLVPILLFLKYNIYYKLNMVSCITGVDLLNKLKRFYLIYEIFSYTNNLRYQVKFFISTKEKVNSVTKHFLSVN